MTLELVACTCGGWHPLDRTPCDELEALPVSSQPPIPADRYLAPSHSRRARPDRARPDQP